jgi:hypothetical protein
MAHFAQVIDGVVKQVIVAEQGFIDTLSDPQNWIQTSYNTRGGVHYDPETGKPSTNQTKAFRKNYAGEGFEYDSQRDAFIPPQPFPSFTLDESTCLWVAPVPKPDDEQTYVWDESTLSWKLLNTQITE